MDVYIYQAEFYCEDCGRSILRRLRRWQHPPNARSESTYDSDEIPKGPISYGGGEADSPQHCGNGPKCRNAETLPDGRKIGSWLENELTPDGVKYVLEEVRQDPYHDNEVVNLWRKLYAIELANA